MKTISDAIPQSSSRLEKTPIDRSDTRSVRAAIAVPIWQATMPANVIVVAVRYVRWSSEPTPTGSPGLQPPSRQDDEEGCQHERRLDEAEPHPGADEHRAPDHALRGRARRPLHEAGLSRLTAEGERRQDLRAEVDREDLHDGERQRYRAAGEREDEERDHLGCRVSEDVDDELADVVEHLTSRLDRDDDRREVVVRQHHRRRLPRDVRSGEPHCDADVGAPQGRGVVDTVTRHRDHLPFGAQRVGDAQLRLG